MKSSNFQFLYGETLSIFLFHKVPINRPSITPDEIDLVDFKRLLDYAESSFNIIAYSDAIDRIRSNKSLPKKAACITFDDGYRDWMTGAVPELKNRNLHATFFITTGQLSGVPLWHERIINAFDKYCEKTIFLAESGLPTINLDSSIDRQLAVKRIESHLKYQALTFRNEMLHQLEEIAGVTSGEGNFFSKNDLLELHAKGFEIGAHTINHPILRMCSHKDAQSEIGGVREEIESIIRAPVKHFAYPNGRPHIDFSENHIKMVKDAGYTSSVTTQPGVFAKSDPLYQIPRFTPWGPDRLRMQMQVARNRITRPVYIQDSTSKYYNYNEPLITVITAVYNGSKYIEATIQSILNQTIASFEYIIIDDASTDDSVDKILSFNDKRIILVKNSVNQKLTKTRNIGLNNARGRYVALIDHDDIAKPERFARQIEFIESDESFVLVGSFAENVDESGQALKQRVKRYDDPEELRARLMFRNPFVNSTLMFKRAEVDTIRYRDQYPLSEDYDFILQLSAIGKIGIIPEILVSYRVHSTNYSSAMLGDMRRLGNQLKQEQIRKIGILATDEELKTHSNFENLCDDIDAEVVGDIFIWVNKLLDSNQSTGYYGNNTFEKVIADEIIDLSGRAVVKKNIGIRPFLNVFYLKSTFHRKKQVFRIFGRLVLARFGA